MSRYTLEIQEMIDVHLKDKFYKINVPFLVTPTRQRYIRTLKPKQLSAFILKYVHNFSVSFISKSLSISRPTVIRYIEHTKNILDQNCGIGKREKVDG